MSENPAPEDPSPEDHRLVTARRYTEMAALYADLFIDDLINSPVGVAMVDELVAQVRGIGSTVLDLGCGPGHVTEYLAGLAVSPIGMDRSAGMIDQAQTRFPNRSFCRGDLSKIPLASESTVGVVARFSTIHLPPAELPAVFNEMARLLAPGGGLAFFFFATDEPEQHGDPFDHKVATAYRLDLDTAAAMLTTAGFVETRRHFQPEENQRSHAALLATRS